MAFTPVVDEVLDSGTTTSLSGSFTADSGALYALHATAAFGTSPAKLNINGDATDSNYYRAKADVSGATQTSNRIAVSSGNSRAGFNGWLFDFDSRPWIIGSNWRDSSAYAKGMGCINTNESAFSSLGLVADTANGLSAGSALKITKIDKTPSHETVVSGSNTTSMTLAPSPVNLEEGVPYILHGCIKHVNGATETSFFINGETTISNYDRGEIGTVRESNSADTIDLVTAANEAVCFVGQAVVYNNFAYLQISYLAVQASAVDFAFASVELNGNTDGIDDLDLTCATSNGIGIGSFVKFYKMES